MVRLLWVDSTMAGMPATHSSTLGAKKEVRVSQEEEQTKHSDTIHTKGGNYKRVFRLLPTVRMNTVERVH